MEEGDFTSSSVTMLYSIEGGKVNDIAGFSVSIWQQCFELYTFQLRFIAYAMPFK